MWKATTESIITLLHIFLLHVPKHILTLLLLSLFSILFFILFSTISTTDSVASKDQWEPPSSPSAIAEPSDMYGWQGLEQAEQLSNQEQLLGRFALCFYHGVSG